MKKFFICIASMITMACLINCSADDGPEAQSTLPRPATFTIHDFGNTGDGSDLFVAFLKIPDETEVESYNLILAKEGNSTGISLDDVAALESSRMYSISKTGFAIREQVRNQFLDTDGDPVTNDQAYRAYIYSKSNSQGTDGSLTIGVSITLADAPYYEVSTLASLPGLEAVSHNGDGYLMMPGSQATLYRVDIATGQYTVFDSGLSWPLGGGYDPDDGSYYASMYGGGQVFKYSPGGDKTVLASGLQGPIGIVKDRDGSLFVANYDGNYISKIAPDGSKSVFADNRSGLINGPDGLVLVNRQLYSINFNDSRILKISSTGEVSLFTTLPSGITGYLAHAGDYFYAPSLAHRKIFRIDMNGNYEEIAGTGAEGLTDGPAMLATFSTPNGIAVSGDTIFIGDNKKIRMLIKRQ